MSGSIWQRTAQHTLEFECTYSVSNLALIGRCFLSTSSQTLLHVVNCVKKNQTFCLSENFGIETESELKNFDIKTELKLKQFLTS